MELKEIATEYTAARNTVINFRIMNWPQGEEEQIEFEMRLMAAEVRLKKAEAARQKWIEENS